MGMVYGTLTTRSHVASAVSPVMCAPPSQTSLPNLPSNVSSQRRILEGTIVGSATQVMLSMSFRATVGQQPTHYHGGHQQPWSSQRPVQRADQPGTRKMAIPAMANRIICVNSASASVALAPQTASLLPSAVRILNTCYASASPCAGFAAQWASL